MASDQPDNANFDAAYAASLATPRRPARLDTFRITPASRSSIRGSTARLSATGDRKLVRMTSSTSSTPSRRTDRRMGRPALLTTASR
jgi:hypothetical protein